MFPSGKIIGSDRNTGLYVLKTTFNVKMAIEGFYNSVLNTMISGDTVKAYLRNSSSPYNIADSSAAVIDAISLTAKFNFFNAAAGNYYLIVSHRNSLETWSGNPVVYNPMGFNTYDFTDSQSKAYGNNMKSIDTSPVRYGVFSGDVNKDQSIDLSDLGMIDNDASNFSIGYIPSDVNGDNVADLSDITITENNAFNFITIIRP